MEFLQYIVNGLVAHPEEVVITRAVDEMGVMFTLTVNSEDMGRVVGRSGNTAQALRTILRTWGMQRSQRIYLKIVDPPGVRFEKHPDEPADVI